MPTKLAVKGALGKAAPGAYPVIQTISDVSSGANPYISAGRNVTGAISGSMAAAGASVLAAEPTGFGWPVIAAAYDQGNRAGQDFFDSAAQRFGMGKETKSSLGNLPSTVNTNLGAYDESVTLPPVGGGNLGSFRSSPPPSLNPDVPQTGTQTGGSNIYAGMSEQEIKDAYDRLRYGDNFDKARDYMKKGQGDPFDSTYNPSKFLVDEAGQKKAVEEGLKMHEAFFGPGGGRLRQLSTPTSSSSTSIIPARGSGVKSGRLGILESAHDKHPNYSGPLQNNMRGSNSFDRDKEPVRGLPTSEDNRKRQQSLRNAQRRLQQASSADGLPQMSPVLRMIRFAEGTEGPDGYRTMYGHRMFDDMSKHPNNPMKTPWGTQSEAAGAFQFMKPTWDEQAAKLGLKDFSPESQVAAAVNLIKSKGIDPYMEINNIDDIVRVADALGPTWAGLPVSYPGHDGKYGRGSSYWGQGGKKVEDIAKYFGIM